MKHRLIVEVDASTYAALTREAFELGPNGVPVADYAARVLELHAQNDQEIRGLIEITDADLDRGWPERLG